MRTTVTLEADVEELVNQAMQERGLTFKAAINAGLRAGLGQRQPQVDYTFPTYALGARVDLTQANRLADQLEDAALLNKLEHAR